jgi:hypothetical protein
MWGITVGLFRGLFVLSPLLFMAVPGFILWWRSGEHLPEFWVALASTVTMFLFNSSSIMWWGGFAIGPRYLLPMLPFMALPIVFVFCRWQRGTWKIVVGIALSAWSLIATWGLTLAGQAFPPDTLQNPLAEYAWPNWRAGNIARNLGMFLDLPGLISLLPLLGCGTVLFATLWFLSCRDPASTTEARSV